MLLNSRTRTVPALVVLALAIAAYLFNFLAALGSDTLGRGHCLQTLDGGTHQIDRIARTDRFGQHVLHADDFEHGTHGAPRDPTGTFRGRLHVYTRRTVVGLDRMPQSAIIQFHARHTAARALHCLRDRDRHFTRLAVTETDLAVTVADHSQRGETHLSAALDRLGHAVDGDELFQHAVAVFTFVV